MITEVMGVLNVTPDSFSDGGLFVDVESAVAHGARMVAEGASVIDVGGESTRPGATPVTEATERDRVVPVIEALVSVHPTVRISVDTRHESVARAAIGAGATMLNDISASLWKVAADTGVAWVAMHMKGEPATMQAAPHYRDVVAEVARRLVEVAAVARRDGVDEVWVDPGFGFGKTTSHNVDLVANLDVLVATGLPVALGVSRKRTLGVLTAAADDGAGIDGGSAPTSTFDDLDRLDRDAVPAPIDDRLEASLVMTTWAVRTGARMIRVHDVAPHVAAAAVAERGASVAGEDCTNDARSATW
ncbi:MAG: dihydropteroate synthase [Microthrixaceae bacterium]